MITEHILEQLKLEKLIKEKQKAFEEYSKKKTFRTINNKAVTTNRLNEFLKRYDYEYD